MSRRFQATFSRLEGRVYENRFTKPHGIQGLDGLVGISGDPLVHGRFP